ncbi:MAG: hypothetical protein ABFS08_02955 [Pseudomonadota bacterium]
MMPKLVSLVATVLLLSACQHATVRDAESPRSRVSVGSSFTLHTALIVPVGHARVFLQGGVVVAKGEVDLYRPHCNVEVRSVSAGDSHIEPDTFVVTVVVEDEEDIVDWKESPRYASLLATADDSVVITITRFVRHTLQSERQPEVMHITCHGGFAEPWQVDYPSISDIRQVLGKLITLKLHNTD